MSLLFAVAVIVVGAVLAATGFYGQICYLREERERRVAIREARVVVTEKLAAVAVCLTNPDMDSVVPGRAWELYVAACGHVDRGDWEAAHRYMGTVLALLEARKQVLDS